MFVLLRKDYVILKVHWYSFIMEPKVVQNVIITMEIYHLTAFAHCHFKTLFETLDGRGEEKRNNVNS